MLFGYFSYFDAQIGISFNRIIHDSNEIRLIASFSMKSLAMYYQRNLELPSPKRLSSSISSSLVAAKRYLDQSITRICKL